MQLTKKLLSIFLLFGTICLAFTSCKKDDAQKKKFYMVCKIDGVKTEFSASTTGHMIWDGGYKEVSIAGTADVTTNPLYMGLNISNMPSQDSIVEGVYADTSVRFSVDGSYGKLDLSMNYMAGTSIYQDQVYYKVTPGQHFVGTITSITDEGIRGSFSGDFYADGDVEQGNLIHVTEGEFYVRRF